jgi:hypothetical protein
MTPDVGVWAGHIEVKEGAFLFTCMVSGSRLQAGDYI